MELKARAKLGLSEYFMAGYVFEVEKTFEKSKEYHLIYLIDKGVGMHVNGILKTDKTLNT